MKLSLVHWLIAAALLANAVVFFWPREPAPEPELTGVGSLRELKLLSELDEPLPARQPRPEAVPRTEPVAAVETDSVGLDSEVQDLQADTAAADEAVEVAEAAKADSELSLEASAEQDQQQESVPPDLAAAPPADEAPAVAEPIAEPEPEPAPEPRRCWIAGPVSSDALSESLAARFAAVGIGLDLVLQTVEVSPDNWVYLPTSGSQSDVRRLARELRQDGFDNFPITDGPLAGSLSMGLFRSEERAAALRDRLRALGHQADIYPRPAFREQPWAAIDDAGREALGWPAEPGRLAGFESLELRERECPADGGD